MGGFAEDFIRLLIKSCWVINKGVLCRRRFVGSDVEGPILPLAQRVALSILALVPGLSIPKETWGWRS